MGAFGLSENRVDMLAIEHQCLGNGIMDACFQAPLVTPG